MVDIETIGVAMDTSGLVKGQRALKDTEQAANKTADAADKVGTSAKQGFKQYADAAAMADRQTQALSSTFGNFNKLVAGSAIALGFRAYVQMADAATMLDSRLKLVTTSTQQLAQVHSELFQIAQGARVNFNELGNTYAQIARASNELGVSQTRLLGVTKTISQAITISGVSAQSANAALMQLTQGLASGTLRGEELNSVMEQTPRLAQAIAQGLGVSIGQLRAMGQEGKLTAESVIGALENSAKSVESEFGRVTPTVSGAMTQIGNSLGVVVGEFDKATGASSSLAGGLQAVSSALDSVGNTISQHRTLFGVIGATLAGGAVVAALPAVAAGLKLVATGVAAIGVALAANPLVLTLLGIGAAVGGGVALYKSYQKTAEGLQATNEALIQQRGAIEQNIAKAEKYGETWDNKLSVQKARLASVNQQIADNNQKLALMNAGSVDTTAEDARLARHAQAMQQTQKDAAMLADTRRQLAGVDKDYLPTLTKLEEAYQRGSMTQKEYVSSVSDLAKQTYKKSEAGKAAAKSAQASAEAERQANAELEKQRKLLAEGSGLTGDFQEKWDSLSDAYRQHRIVLSDLIDRQAKLLAQQPAIKHNNEEEAKQLKAINEAAAELAKAGTKEAKSVEDQIEKQREHNEQIGLSSAQIQSLTADKIDLEAASDRLLAASWREAAQLAGPLHDYYIQYANDIEKAADLKNKLANEKRTGAVKQAEVEAAKASAEEWKKFYDSIYNGLSDSLYRSFEAGKGFFKTFWDGIRNTFKTTVLKFAVQGVMTGILGLPGTASASGGISMLSSIGTASSTYSGLSSLGGMANAVGLGGAYNTVAGWFGATGMGLTGAGSIGGASSLASMGLAGGGMGAPVASTVATEAAGASGIMGSIGTAMPYLAAAAAIYAIAKSLDHSGTYHTGALAEYSAATGLLTGSNGSHAGPRAGDTNYGTGFGGVDFSQQTADFVSGVSKSIVGILDSTASTFGKTAGYTAATAFADDTSKDGAWGALLIQKMGQSVVNWNDTRNSSWAPREFGDGEAGRTQYLAELSKSVRTALDDIGLPGWAQSMLDNLGNAPALTDLAAVVDKINATQKALVSMGDAIAGFTTLSDAAVTALVSASGGVDSFVAGMNAFYEGYYTDAEKIANVSGQVSDALSAVGLAMPQTREEFRALVEQELALGESGASAVAALLRVSGAFGTVADYSKRMADEAIANAQRQAEETAQAQQQAAETARQAAISTAQTALDTAMKGVDAAFSAVQRAVGAERKSITDAYNDQIKSINASITDVTGSVGKLTSLSNSLRSTIDRMRLPDQYGADRASAQAQIQTAIAIAKAGGVLPDAESLSSALNIVSQPSEQLFSSFKDYQADFLKTKNSIADLADITDLQKSVEERTLSTLQDQLRATEQGYQDEMTRLDGVLSAAQLQIDTLRGIDQSVMSVAAAIANLQISIGTAASAQANLSNVTGTTPDSIAGLYSNILGRAPDAQGAEWWQNAISTYQMPWDQVVTDFIGGAIHTGGTDEERARQWAREHNIPGFDVGTNYVTHDMTARIHAGEEITPRPYVDMQRVERNKTNDLLSQLVEENRSMRAELSKLRSATDEGNRHLVRAANAVNGNPEAPMLVETAA